MQYLTVFNIILIAITAICLMNGWLYLTIFFCLFLATRFMKINKKQAKKVAKSAPVSQSPAGRVRK